LFFERHTHTHTTRTFLIPPNSLWALMTPLPSRSISTILQESKEWCNLQGDDDYLAERICCAPSAADCCDPNVTVISLTSVGGFIGLVLMILACCACCGCCPLYKKLCCAPSGGCCVPENKDAEAGTNVEMNKA
jgi:hypothetical protein